MAAMQQALVTPDSFKGDFSTGKLLNRLSERILDQHEARVANTSARTKQQQVLPYDSLVSMDQLVMQFERADRELQALRSELDSRVSARSAEVGEAEEQFQDMFADLEENVGAITEGFADLDRRMNSVTSVATKFGDRLQGIDAYRENAADAVRIIQALQEFSNAEDLQELSELFQDDGRLEEAAALTRRSLELASEVTRANERVSALPAAGATNGAKKPLAEKGTIEHARDMLEEYRNRLQQRVMGRFDKAEGRRDLGDMAACARVMQEFEGSPSSPSLVQRYISMRSVFTDPKELALGHSEPVVDTVTAQSAKRRLGTLYKSVTAAVRHEAAIMAAVFARPKEALSALVHRVFEQRIQTVLGQMLRLPGPDARKEVLEAYLKLLAEAYQSTSTLARAMQEPVGSEANVMELANLAFAEALEQYPELELRLLRLHYRGSPYMGPRGVLLQDPVVQWFKWNQDVLDRASTLCTDPAQRADVVRRTIHNSSAKQEDVGCLLEQVAIHLMTGLDGALENCRQRRWPPYASASLASMQRATVRQAALRVAQQGIGHVLGAISQAGAIIKMLQGHYSAKVAGLLEPAPAVAQACSRGFAAMLRATEDHIMAALEAALADFFDVVGGVLTTEQKRQDFRPAEEVHSALSQPTEACALAAALLAAVLQEGSQTLQASNLASFNAQLGARALKALDAHVERYTFSPTGALRWKRDLAEYGDALAPAVAASPAVRARMDELTSGASLLVVAPDSLLPLVDNSLRWPHAQALRIVRLRHDFKAAKVRGKSLAALFADA